MTNTSIKCTYCGREIDEEPFEDEQDDPMCGRCWKEHMCFYCPICKTRKWKGEEEEHKQYIVIDNIESPEPGIYRVKDRPFYRSDYFNIRYDEDNLQKVAEITEDFDMSGRLVGSYICLDCIKNIHELDEIRMMKHGNCLWCGRPNVTLMDGRFCGLCSSELPEYLKPEEKNE